MDFLKKYPGFFFSAATFALVLAYFIINQDSAADQSTAKGQNGVLLFNSGFEPDSRIHHRGDPFTGDDKIIGKDSSVPPPNDWVADIDQSLALGDFSLQYQGADTTKRIARIIPEPGNPGNHVLKFQINEPWVNHRGSRLARIQANIYDENPNRDVESIRELYQKVRLFLHKDMEIVKEYPNRIHWLTIFELWNNKTWGPELDPYPFRVTVGMGKPSAEDRELYFMVDAQDYAHRTGTTRGGYTTIWSDMETNVPIPIETWMTLEYYVKEGDEQTGRFYMSMTPDGGEKKVLFDINNFTHNTSDPNPDGISLWNPMKLYTSTDLTNFVKDNGKSLRVYWDDFEVWKNKKP
jgi:hypothetical protein